MSQYIEKRWFALDATIETRAREAVEYALMEAGSRGTEVNDASKEKLVVSAYFDVLPDREQVRAELFAALHIYSLPTSSVHDMTIREVADQDWLGEWKKGWQAVPAGERFIVAPSWVEIPDISDRIVIRIEPGMAFGTGTHETTQLCLAAIEKHFSGASFLDVGTGTGILAIAAGKLFPNARIEACDTDREAIAIARENAKLNEVSGQIVFRVGTINEIQTSSADCVCANLTAGAIKGLLPSLVATTCDRLILSGILDSQIEMIVEGLQALGITTPCEITTAGEWACIIV